MLLPPPGREHWVTGPDGDLMVIGDDLTKLGNTDLAGTKYMRGTESLTELVPKLREHAQLLLDHAAWLEAAAADGWVLERHFTYGWDLVDTKDGPSFATEPPG